jgi:hypothetical protein
LRSDSLHILEQKRLAANLLASSGLPSERRRRVSGVWQRSQAFGLDGMSTRDILLIIVVLVLIGSLPVYGYNRSWGWGPSGIVGLLLVVLLILLLMGRLG